MSVEDLSPASMPFNTYVSEYLPTQADAANHARHSVAMAKRILLQEKIRDFTSADVIALAAIIESRAGGV